MFDSIMGCPVAASYDKCGLLWEHVKEMMEYLLLLDVYDDDQMLLWLANKKYPNDFTLHKSDWFKGMKDCGGDHLSIKEFECSRPSANKMRMRKIASHVKRSLLKHIGVQPRSIKKFCDHMGKLITEEEY